VNRYGITGLVMDNAVFDDLLSKTIFEPGENYVFEAWRHLNVLYEILLMRVCLIDNLICRLAILFLRVAYLIHRSWNGCIRRYILPRQKTSPVGDKSQGEQNLAPVPGRAVDQGGGIRIL
jgi:hypothetical protein